MGDEIARAELAIKRSLKGQTVALISSGDPGVLEWQMYYIKLLVNMMTLM